mgnify:CR=1 FL=1|tara:strand:+ start:518 stop:727 length:210 start_codon:yes stop_codon:yes gene_type:complete
MKHFKISNLITSLIFLAFMPIAFVALLGVSLISGVGGVLHIIVYDLYPMLKKQIKEVKLAFSNFLWLIR